MRAMGEFPKIYLYVPAVDMRKQLPGLSVMIADALGHDPFSGGLYMFRGRRRDLIKCVYWDKTGFAMWVKNLIASFSHGQGHHRQTKQFFCHQNKLHCYLRALRSGKLKNIKY